MSILEIKNLCHRYDEKPLLDNANLVVNNGEHLGIVGLNGAGKSTFINIVANKITWDSGEVNFLSGIRWGYLDQYATLDKNITVIDYLREAFKHLFELKERLDGVYAQMGELADDPDELERLINRSSKMEETLTDEHFYDIDAQIKKVANGLGINNVGYDSLIGTLSGGQRAKLMLSKLLLQENDLMLLDEPTNFLDLEHIDWLKKYLVSFKKTFMVISHDTDFLNAVCTSIVNIENGGIKKYAGNYTQFTAQREMNAKQYEDDYKRQQAEIKRLKDYIDKNKARASTARMANSREKMLDRIDVMQKPVTIYDAEFSFPYLELNSREFLTVKNLSIGYGSPILPPISFTMESGTKLWVRGTNGVGKTTLVKTLMRQIRALGGFFSFHIASKPAYLAQDFDFPDENRTASGFLSDCFPRFNPKEIRGELAKVGIKGELAIKPIETLSGGEKVRVKLAVLCNIPSNVLILDEPTNHLDVRAKESLKKALTEYRGAIILVSHEREFAGEICDKILDVVSAK